MIERTRSSRSSGNGWWRLAKDEAEQAVLVDREVARFRPIAKRRDGWLQVALTSRGWFGEPENQSRHRAAQGADFTTWGSSTTPPRA